VTIRIRQASASDVDAVVELRREAATWLAEIGSDQWSDASIDLSEFRRRVESSIAAGETWVAVDDEDVVVGTIAIDEHTNPGLWSPDELEDALILHRMIRSARAPQGTGRLLLQQATEVARAAGRGWIKLDAWTTNYDLHRYYESMGFRHVRTVHGHHTYSAALFELPVNDTPREEPHKEAPVRKTP
jgi:predicted N-acetyltransferase YhbS